jgi:putative transposase
MPTEYPIEFKRKVMKRYENGESLKNLSEELHVALTTLYRWRKSHCTIRTQNRTYTPAEFDAISRRLQKLEHLKSLSFQGLLKTFL